MFLDPEGEDAFRGPLADEAQLIDARARRIRVAPAATGEAQVAEYVIDPSTRKFAGLELVEESRPPHRGSSPTFRTARIDMSAVRRIAEYDKAGGKLLAQALKYHLFGSSAARLTRERCEAFFDDDGNFDL